MTLQELFKNRPGDAGLLVQHFQQGQRQLMSNSPRDLLEYEVRVATENTSIVGRQKQQPLTIDEIVVRAYAASPQQVFAIAANVVVAAQGGEQGVTWTVAPEPYIEAYFHEQSLAAGRACALLALNHLTVAEIALNEGSPEAEETIRVVADFNAALWAMGRLQRMITPDGWTEPPLPDYITKGFRQ